MPNDPAKIAEWEEDFESMISDWGPPDEVRPVPVALIEKYRPILPPILLYYWEHYGFMRFKQGQYFIINPDDWQATVDDWLADTPFAEMGRFYALARTAFGKIYLYHPVFGYKVTINAEIASASARNMNPEDERGLEISIGHLYGMSSPRSMDAVDANGDKLFDRALKRLGPVGWDEMYTFEPPVFAGGPNTLSSMAKVTWAPQMAILRQMAGTPDVPFTDLREESRSLGIDLDAILAAMPLPPKD